MDKNGIVFGKRVGLDSTPLSTLKNDVVGVINGHYYEMQGVQRMIKVHTLICLDTGLPLAMCVSDGLAYDGNYLIPLLQKARTLGINFKEVYADGHYNTLENWAKVSIYFGAKCYFNLSKKDTFREDGTYDNIKRQYQKYHNSAHRDWKVTKDVHDMMEYMVYHGKHEPVGAWFRDEHWELKKNDSEEYTKFKGRREPCENFHSVLKEQLDFDKHLSKKGWNNIEMYALEFMITIAMQAYIRAKNGVKDGFMKISEGVFN